MLGFRVEIVAGFPLQPAPTEEFSVAENACEQCRDEISFSACSSLLIRVSQNAVRLSKLWRRLAGNNEEPHQLT